MSFKLIAPEERHKYKCYVCNATKSVKYLIPTQEDGELHDLPYCNRCALLHSVFAEKNNTTK
jgi:hypothetical protein